MKRRKPPSKGGATEGAGGHTGFGEQLLRQGLHRLGLHPTPLLVEALTVYLSELLRWGTRVNLTGFRTEEAIVRDGFLGSLAYRAAFEPAPGLRAVDIGSGAGFPGLVLKICYPEIDMLLVEAARRRVTFLRSLIRQLGLVGVRCLHGRAEQLKADAEHRSRYQLAFARGVGPLPNVIELAEPLLAPGGRLVLQMGRKTAGELGAAQPRLAQLGLRAELRDVLVLEPQAQTTRLLVVEKPSGFAA